MFPIFKEHGLTSRYGVFRQRRNQVSVGELGVAEWSSRISGGGLMLVVVAGSLRGSQKLISLHATGQFVPSRQLANAGET